MTSGLDASFDVTNTQGFSALRAASDTPEGRRAVAQQFESIFLNLMLTEMRSAGTIDGGLIDDDRLEFQQNLFDQQLALSLARGKGIGLADAILRSLERNGISPPVGSDRAVPPASATASSVAADAVSATPARAAPTPTVPVGKNNWLHAVVAARQPSAPTPAPGAAKRGEPAERDFAASPRAFVAALWPHAEQAARELGTVPDVLVAQAALETGWGRSMPRNQYGDVSLNLFGIKAGADWRGPRAVVRTLEFVDGVPEVRHEPFRMYQNFGDTFGDYVALVRGKPRYAQALNAASPEEYARALQQGGYATDPDYAAKITAILARGLPGREAAVAAGQVIAESADTPIAGARTDMLGSGEGV